MQGTIVIGCLFLLLLGGGREGARLLIQQLSELEAFEEFLKLVVVRLLKLQKVHIEADWNLLVDSRQPLALLDLFDVVLNLFLQRTLQFVRRSQQILDASELLDEFLSCLLPHSRAARNVIDGISHQSQHVDNLRRRLQSPLLLHFLDAQNLCLAVLPNRRSIDFNLFCDELSEVLIRRHHKGIYTLLISLMSQRADDIIRLKPRYFEHGNAIGSQYFLDDGHGKPDCFGRFLSLGLILGEGFVPESTAMRVEGNTQMRRFALANHLFKRVDKTENGRRVFALRVDSRVLYEGVISTINQCVSIK